MDNETVILTFSIEVDKSQLHNDAKRLFLNEAPEVSPSAEWSAEFNEKYKSYSKAARFALRDGAAFATVALPAHYSAIVSVFDHMKRRLGPELKVKRVIDWGAATGSGLWYCLTHFLMPLSLTSFTQGIVALVSEARTHFTSRKGRQSS